MGGSFSRSSSVARVGKPFILSANNRPSPRTTMFAKFSLGRERAGVRVKEWAYPLSCDTVGFLLPSASHTLKTLRMSETLWVVGVAQG